MEWEISQICATSVLKIKILFYLESGAILLRKVLQSMKRILLSLTEQPRTRTPPAAPLFKYLYSAQVCALLDFQQTGLKLALDITNVVDEHTPVYISINECSGNTLHGVGHVHMHKKAGCRLSSRRGGGASHIHRPA